jgi:hypothetical protein
MTTTNTITTNEQREVIKEALTVMTGIRLHMQHATKKHIKHCCIHAVMAQEDVCY